MELNIKSKFNVGDVVTVTRLQETGTIRNWKVNVSEKEVSISYNIWFNDQVGSGWVAELDLKSARPVSKFKLGDAVTWDDQHGVVTEVFDDNIVAVEVTTDSGHRHLLYESELSPHTPTSPHYFQD